MVQLGLVRRGLGRVRYGFIMMITVTIIVPIEHATSPHEQVLEALEATYHTVKGSTPENPSIGGKLRNKEGREIGSYRVGFV